MSNIERDCALADCHDWLAEYGREPHDVMEDGVGFYIYVDYENGVEKVYLPEQFDPTFWG